MTTAASIQLIWPEIVLALAAVVIYVGGTWKQMRDLSPLFAAGALLVCGYALSMQVEPNNSLFFSGGFKDWQGPVVLDALAYFVRWTALVSGFLLLLAGIRGGGEQLRSEYIGTLLLAVVGVMLAAAAADLVLLFVSLELISVPTYVLLFLGRSSRTNGEATAKYFFLSILSSAIFLYGVSMLYGAAGSTALAEITTQLAAQSESTSGQAAFTPLALVLITAGLAFKIAAVPLHFYAPDVYQGATNANAALLAVLPKIAGIVALVRIVTFAMPGVGEFAWQLLLVLSVLTMTLGNVAALWQSNLRRMLAYSSIAHSGYMLIGLSAALAARQMSPGSDVAVAAVSATLLYLAVYVPATLGGFAVLAYLSDRRREFSTLDELAGLGRTRPLAAALLAVCMFSLTGIPPLAGFWGKLSLFSAALDTAWLAGGSTAQTWFIALAVIGVLNAAISAGYYLKVVGAMYFQESFLTPTSDGPRSALASAGLGAALVVFFGLLPGMLINRSAGAGNAASRLQADDALPIHLSELPAAIAATSVHFHPDRPDSPAAHPTASSSAGR